MAWIQTLKPTPENPELADAFRQALEGYPKEYSPAVKAEMNLPEAVKNESIVLSHSLIPNAMRHFFAGYAALLDPKLPLGRRQHEMIAATVSVLNTCFYWVEAHAEFLRVASLDAELAAAIKKDWRTAPITDAERVMLGYVEKLTRKPWTVGKDDIDALRGAGFDDVAILQINLIASFFNYINRVADGLGFGRGG